MEREALKLALEALESSRVFVTTREKIKHPEGTKWYDERITAIKEALAQPAQAPVAYVTGMSFGRFIVEPLKPAMVLPVGMALYSSLQGNL